MKQNNLLVGIAILLAATACTQGRYLGVDKEKVDGEKIATTADNHEGSEDWAVDQKKGDFNPGTYKCNLFVYDVLNEAGATAPKQPSGRWPLTAADWANPTKSITDWPYMGKAPNVTWQRGDVIAEKRSYYGNATGHCGIAVSSSEVMGVQGGIVTKGDHGLQQGSVRRYTGS